MVLNGGYAPGTRKNLRPHGMPPFARLLNDAEVSAVVTYIRVAWDNSGTPVTSAQSSELRKLLPE
jgi:mono/diheme cytochrome c family protein